MQSRFFILHDVPSFEFEHNDRKQHRGCRRCDKKASAMQQKAWRRIKWNAALSRKTLDVKEVDNGISCFKGFSDNTVTAFSSAVESRGKSEDRWIITHVAFGPADTDHSFDSVFF